MPGLTVTKVPSVSDGINSSIVGVLDAPGDSINYTVTVSVIKDNPGDTYSYSVSVDDDVVSLSYFSGDTNTNTLLDTDETWTYKGTYATTQADYDSNGTLESSNNPGFVDQAGRIDNNVVFDLDGVYNNVSDTLNGSASANRSLSINPDIDIEKATNGEDADDPTGPVIAVGDPVTWTYVVTNTGNVTLTNVVVTDDNGPGADFNPTPVDNDGDGSIAGDDPDDNDNSLTGDGLLAPNEQWFYEETGTATAGQYENIADVSGYYTAGDDTVTDDDPSHYFGVDVQIAILKETNGTDDECPNILVGETVTWTYQVTNPGSVPLLNVVVVDDNGTPDTGDDFNPTPVDNDGDGSIAGDDPDDNDNSQTGDGLLDPGETWLYEYSGTAVAGEYSNIATANGAFIIPEQTNIPADEASEDDCYNGVEAGIAIVKTTNGTDNVCPVVEVGSAVIWGYTVTNTGDLAIENVVVVDDNGTAGNLLDDFNPTFTGGDTNGNSKLDVGETWTYSANGVAQAGDYVNVATVNGTASDDVGNTANVTDNEADCYEGEVPRECVGVGTPGFWANNGAVFWDGIADNEDKAGKPGFASGELLYPVDSDGDGDIDGDDDAGLLIGDFNGDGLSVGEDTIFIALADAKALISGGGGSNGVDKLGRDLVATWLNFQANGEDCINLPGTNDDGFNPSHYIDEAVNWLQRYASDKDSYLVDFATFDDDTEVKPKSGAWKDDFIGGDHSASEMHSALDGYNNTGYINGIEFCCDRDAVTLV